MESINKMIKRMKYNHICNELDQILIKSGIREECIKCSNNEKNKIGMCGGCCFNCSWITPKGCSIKSISCKGFLCSQKQRIMITKAGFAKRFIELIRISVDEGWYYGNRYKLDWKGNLIVKFICFDNEKMFRAGFNKKSGGK